ncbi:type VI secretion system baseplate subunit TssF [Bosea sp. (in: a-proteobacteria)]|uniref:type VI secretion system baseplate subunit TssF n=1 Tax=Bosea sp. (in: a-proteobacteria) TaxID=1871050 RepID=UPI003B3A1DD2
MDRELVEFYKRELSLLYEQAAAFSEEFPGIADRLGGLARDRGDPMVIGLLEGTALLAARVQLKLKHEFSEFTFNLIDQLLPNYLAPTPSLMLAQIRPPYGDPELKSGKRIAKGSLIDAVYLDKDRNIACTFSLCDDVVYGPFDIPRAEYMPSLAPIQALGLNADGQDAAGLRLTLRLRMVARAEDEPNDADGAKDPAADVAGTAIDTLPVHLVGPEADAIALYEQMFAHLNGVHLRYLDSFGDARFIRLGKECVEQIGFDADQALLPYEARQFRGFELLQEYTVFPRKFMGFRIRGLRKALAAARGRSVDLVFTFGQANPRLAAAVDPAMFALYAVPAVNLFKKTCDRIPIKANQHEYQVVPDRTQMLGFEPHRLIDVYLHQAGQKQKQRVQPIYRSTLEPAGSDKLFFSIRRLERKRTARERRGESAARYAGTETYISLSPPSGGGEAGKPELSVVAYCSNRHLAEFLPVGRGGTDFRLRENAALEIAAVVAPTPPRDPPMLWRHENPRVSTSGRMAWRLVNLLNLNHLGVGRSDGSALRETLSLFADLDDPVMERRIRGIRSVALREVVRRLPQRTGVGVARGIEVRLTLDDKAFEGSGAFLLGAVLERFFAEYVSLNHFVQTVVETTERGVIARWPPRSGSRTAL